jgi:two-component system, OmpR family, phosphate regulon response regulator PhoB
MNEARATQRSSANTAPRVLVVEDEAALSLLLAYNLEAEGYLVERVERGDEAS